MQKSNTCVIERRAPLREVHCERLPHFRCANLDSVRGAFASAVSLPFRQTWLPEAEEGFCGGEVRLGWRERSLWVFADMMDRDIFSTATGPNQRLWELGDTFEMLFKSVGRESYVEFQVAPQNQCLQLRFPHSEAVDHARATGRFEEFVIRDDPFRCHTWIAPGRNRWQVCAEISPKAVCGADEPFGNARWQFSFGRYDHTRGLQEPVISSTSLHDRPDFHRPQEWNRLVFKTHA